MAPKRNFFSRMRYKRNFYILAENKFLWKKINFQMTRLNTANRL